MSALMSSHDFEICFISRAYAISVRGGGVVSCRSLSVIVTEERGMQVIDYNQAACHKSIKHRCPNEKFREIEQIASLFHL